MDIVIARYNESLLWYSAVMVGPRKVVYNKGEGELRPLPNIGREAHTYLHHILETFPEFPDWTFFTQGNPSDHCTSLAGIVNQWPHSYRKSAFYIEGGPILFANEPVRYVEEKPIGDDAGNDVLGLWAELFSSPPPQEILFAPGAIFAISKERLHSRSWAFYKRAYELAGTRPRAPWEFERLWAYLWTSSAATKL
jgi:hypothetical protein